MMLRILLCLMVVAYVVSAASADEKPASISIATWNLEWFFDDYTGDNFGDLPKEQSAPNRAEWEWKRDAAAAAIAAMKPTVLALQEVENSRTVYYLTKQLKEKHGLTYRIAFVQGFEFFTEQDVAVIYRSGLVEFSRREQSQEMWQSKDFYNLSKHLFCRFEWGQGEDREQLLLLNLHLRAQGNGAPIRQRQARLARHWVAGALSRGENVVVLGDINTDELYGSKADDSDVSILAGSETKSTDDDLIDLHGRLPADARATHLIGKQFDRIFVSPSLLADRPGARDLVFKSIANRKDVCVRGAAADKDHWNIYYKIPQAERDISDHYPLIAEFDFR